MRASFSDFLTLFTLSFLWGTSYVAIKLALVDVDPISLAAIRLIISAIMLYAYMKYIGHKLPKDLETWRVITIVGIGGMAVPFFLIGWGMQEMTSSLAGVIIAITPIMVLILSHYMLHDHKITKTQTIGMAFGFIGIFILMGGFSVFEVNTSNIAKLAILLSAFGFAYTAVRMRELYHLSPTVTATGVTIVSAVSITIVSLFNAPIWQVEMNMDSITALLYLSLFSTVIGTILMAKIIFSAGPPFMSLNNFLVPIVAVIAGILMLNDTISKEFNLATILILIGVVMAAPKQKKT
jgi:drug/metabolite transporter (DMT)-like permease